MSAPALVCPKCDGKMKQGFVMDNTYGGRVVSHWAAGHPQRSFFMGTKLPEEDQIPVGVFRCEECGFLESYARPEFRAQ